ncbi:MAG: hypothetical protein ACK4UK_07010 [Flavobacterium sp.]
MESNLKKLKNVVAETCVTIILNTHRTKPDHLKDPLTLKNLIKEAQQRLESDLDKRKAKAIIDRIFELEKSIDHSHNLESLILFVNENIAEYVRLPVAVTDRVVIDPTFATRDLVRSLHLESGYYVLLLSRQKVRLIEAFNDKVVREIDKPFPIENTQFYSTNGVELSNASRQTQLVAEFFNRVDKEVNLQRKENPLPVLICSEESNFHEYLKIADQKQSIYPTFLNRNRLDEKDHAIVSEAWPLIKEISTQKNHARIEELEKAVGTGKFMSDLNDIWRALTEGRVQTLFVQQGLYQRARLDGEQLIKVGDTENVSGEVIDDIYDEMIEISLEYGGDVVFLPPGPLEAFQGFGAVLRY